MSTPSAAITPSSDTLREIISQPALWELMRERAASDAGTVLGKGRALVLGCGTSAFVAQAIAALREGAGRGETDWCFASEAPIRRSYRHVLAITRSATTTEVLETLERLPREGTRSAIVAVDSATSERLTGMVDSIVSLTEADEVSVVQTRFPTSVLTLVREALGVCPPDIADQARAALAVDLPDLDGLSHFVFLGVGWTIGLAHEAALKVREMAQAWSESGPALDYRHGPIAVAGRHSLIMVFGEPPPGLALELRATGATVLISDFDPLAQLIVAQRIALALAHQRGCNPDQPNRLSRSVILHTPTFT
jgi:glutamine---fructose-6-phosphate transaminase (isomerizing)